MTAYSSLTPYTSRGLIRVDGRNRTYVSPGDVVHVVDPNHCPSTRLHDVNQPGSQLESTSTHTGTGSSGTRRSDTDPRLP